MLFVIILSGLLHYGFSACNLTAFELLQRCQNDDVANPPCSEGCQNAIQEANECTQRGQDLESVMQTYYFCKPGPEKRCRLTLRRELCRGSCQWCNNKCLTRDAECRKAPVNCSTLVQLQCNTQCIWCSDTQICAKTCTSSPPTPSSSNCVDDPQSKLAVFGYTCTSLFEVISDNCEYNLSSLGQTFNGMTFGKLCPKTCSQCPPATPPAAVTPPPPPPPVTSSVTCVDDPTGIVAQQGFNCATVLQVTSNNCDYDLSALSPQIPKGVTPAQICPKSCQRCGSGDTPAGVTATAGVSAPTIGVSNSNGNCADDPEGLAAQQGLTCSIVLGFVNNNCDVDLSSLNPNVPAGLTAARLCPKTCNHCDGATTSRPALPQVCMDDASGLVKANGFTCETVLSVTGNNCDQDLSTLSPSIPKGITPGQLCAKSCGRCKDANGNTSPTPQRTTDSFINGKLVTNRQKNMLQGLGVQLPPGRYFLRPDGSVGIEGGPVLLNIYQATGQKIDTAITEAFQNSGIEDASTKTRDWTTQATQTTKQAVNQAVQKTRTGFQNFVSRVSSFFG